MHSNVSYLNRPTERNFVLANLTTPQRLSSTGGQVLITDIPVNNVKGIKIPRQQAIITSPRASLAEVMFLKRTSNTAFGNTVQSGKNFRPELDRADIVFLPHPNDPSSMNISYRNQTIRKLSAAGKSPTIISADQNELIVTDVAIGYDGKMGLSKLKAILVHKSQMRRTPFHQVALIADKASSGNHTFTEKFVHSKLVNGVLTPTKQGDKIDIKHILNTFSDVIFVSPHPDDDLKADALFMMLAQHSPRGTITSTNLLLSTGYAAYIPDVSSCDEKGRIRIQEAQDSANHIGFALKTILPGFSESEMASHNYEHIPMDLLGQVQQFLGEKLKSSNGKKLLLIIPHELDMHPSHIEARDLILEACKSLPTESLEFFEYASPWAGKYNTWLYSSLGETEHAQRVINPEKYNDGLFTARIHGHVGGELLLGVGSSPYLGTRAAAEAGLGSLAFRYYVQDFNEALAALPA